MKFKLIPLLLLTIISVKAQYTEIINSNRPGESFGAYSVGTNVLQFETGIAYGVNNHSSIRVPDRTNVDYQYQIRYGMEIERVELILDGTFVSAEEKLLRGGTETINSFSNFRNNTLGAKYLLYDPNIKKIIEKPNLYSWRQNNKMKWRDLIPAVSIYGGMNLLFGENPFKFFGESVISLKGALIFQHNIGTNWVLVSNVIADKPRSKFPTYAGIFTLTHTVFDRTGVFAEFQTYISDWYSDEIVRGGVAFMVHRNLQVDVSGLFNFKDSPSRWRAGIGVSYRIDMHDEDEYIFKNKQEESLYLEEKSGK